MSSTVFVQLLDLAVGSTLLCAFAILWRRDLVAIVRALSVQGIALGIVAGLIGIYHHESELVAVAAFVLILKGAVLPGVLLRIIGAGDETREVHPRVNVPASLLTAAALTLLAYATSQSVVALDPSAETRAIPIGLATALIGVFVLANRHKAVTQVIGFVVLDNGISLVAFLATTGVPLVVELGVALDVLAAVLILQVLTARMRAKFGVTDLDQLRELHD
jgi:hydrogenase-4 component E